MAIGVIGFDESFLFIIKSLYELIDLILRQIVFLVHLVLQHILESQFELHGLREGVPCIPEDRHDEDALPVLRDSIVLRVEDLLEIGVALIREPVAPLQESRAELVADEGLDVLHQEIFRMFRSNGPLALPKERGPRTATFLPPPLEPCVGEILTRARIGEQIEIGNL